MYITEGERHAKPAHREASKKLTATAEPKMLTMLREVTELTEVEEIRKVTEFRKAAELKRETELLSATVDSTTTLAFESMSTAGATQHHCKYQQQPQRTEPNTQPKKLNATETIIEIAEVDASTNDLVEAHSTATKNSATSLHSPQHSSFCECTISDAAIVLRVPSCSRIKNCNKTDLCTLSAHLLVTTLPAPTSACRLSAPAVNVATVGPETLATNQRTCRTVCSKHQITIQRELGVVEKEEKLYLADAAPHSCPPPLFIILVSLLEIAVFIYDYMTVHLTTTTIVDVEPPKTSGMSLTDISSFNNEPFIVSESSLIYRPDRRLQLWRYVSYMLLHANCYHLSFNVLAQLAYGLPLEWVHGSARIAIIYLAGVFAGSLGTSVVDSGVCLVGASGGVYALLAAYLANILLNFGEMRSGVAQLGRLGVFVSCDLCYALYTKYHNNNDNSAPNSMIRESQPTISYIAHLCGALAGFTMACLVLRHFDTTQASFAKLLWWLALGAYAAFMLFAIAFNLINTVTAQMLEEEESGEVVKLNLLHNLGIS